MEINEQSGPNDMQGTFGGKEDRLSLQHKTQDIKKKVVQGKHDYLQRVAYQGESPNMSF